MSHAAQPSHTRSSRQPELLSYSLHPDTSSSSHGQQKARPSQHSAITPRTSQQQQQQQQPIASMQRQRYENGQTASTGSTLRQHENAALESIFANYKFSSSHAAPYNSPIRSSGQGHATSTPPSQPTFAKQQQQQPQQPSPRPSYQPLYDPSDSTPVHSPAPRTPPRVASSAVTGHADLRYPTTSTEARQHAAAAAANGNAALTPTSTTPLSQRLRDTYMPSAQASGYVFSPSAGEHRYGGERHKGTASTSCVRNGAASTAAAAAAAAALTPASMCWLCESRCLTGPGSTWAAAPPLFFAAAAPQHAHTVSNLTLCRTCAAAVSADPDATSQEVLQRCQRTPAVRYRTSAYVNAVREYKLLLELMAEKVVRACERMQRIHQVTPAGPGREYAGPMRDVSIEVSTAPLAAFGTALQQKVLRQLLDALDELLRCDSRATQLAATGTKTSNGYSAARGANTGSPQVPFSEIMASRERHLLMEEVAHVERQLMDVNAAAAAAEGELGEAVPTSPEDPHCTESGTRKGSPQGRVSAAASRRRRPKVEDDFVVLSPRPSSDPQPDDAALTRLADPRRVSVQQPPQRAHQYAGTDDHHVGDSNGSADQREDRSPPELTSPQRRGHRSSDQVTRGPAPFPFSPAPHRDHSHSGSPQRDSTDQTDNPRGQNATHRYVTDDETRAGRQEKNRTPTTTARATRGSSQPRQQKSASPGRSAMAVVVGSAMWAAHRNDYPSNEHDDTAKNHASEMEFPCDENTARGAHSSSTNDPENILLNYFAGRSTVTPRFREAPAEATAKYDDPSPLRRPAQPSSVSPGRHRSGHRTDRSRTGHIIAAPAEGRLVDLANGGTTSRTGPFGEVREASAEVWQARFANERERRQEAEEALMTAHARIAALEQTTNDMAETLLSHRLAVTFRYHLQGMDMLLNRWTLLAQNFCLQKSLLFAEEAAAVVRMVQRDAYGIRALLLPASVEAASPPPPRPQQSRGGAVKGRINKSFVRSTGREVAGEDEKSEFEPPYAHTNRGTCGSGCATKSQSVSGDSVERDEELWVARDADGAQQRGVDDDDDDNVNEQAAYKHAAEDDAGLSAHQRNTSSSAQAAPFTFPTELRLKPLTLKL